MRGAVYTLAGAIVLYVVIAFAIGFIEGATGQCLPLPVIPFGKCTIQ